MRRRIIGPLALIWLIHSDGGLAFNSNSTAGYSQGGNIQHLGTFNASMPSSVVPTPSINVTSPGNHSGVSIDSSVSHLTYATSLAATPENENTASTDLVRDSGTAAGESVDFEQWINMDMFENEDIPSTSIRWNHPDYGPVEEKITQQVVAQQQSLPNTSLSNNPSEADFKVDKIEGKLLSDTVLDNGSSPEANDDGRESGHTGLYLHRKSLACDGSYDNCSPQAEDLKGGMSPWEQNARAPKQGPNGHERLKYEDSHPHYDTSSLWPTLAMVVAAFPEVVSKEHRRKRRQNNPKDTHATQNSRTPRTWNDEVLMLNVPSQVAIPPRDMSFRKSTNSGTRTHICITCNASSGRFFELKKHAKYHTKPIACHEPNCTRRFGRQRDLTRHQKSAHKEAHESEKWFCPYGTCRYARLPFGRRDNLLRHMRNMHSQVEM